MSYYGGQDSSGSRYYPSSYSDQANNPSLGSRYDSQSFQSTRKESARVNTFLEGRQYGRVEADYPPRPPVPAFPTSPESRWRAAEERRAFEELESIEKDVLDLVHTAQPSSNRNDDQLNSFPSSSESYSEYQRQRNPEPERFSPYAKKPQAHNFSDYDQRSSFQRNRYEASEQSSDVAYADSSGYRPDKEYPHQRYNEESSNLHNNYSTAKTHLSQPAQEQYNDVGDDSHDTLAGFSRNDLLQYLQKLKGDAEESDKRSKSGNDVGQGTSNSTYSLEKKEDSRFPPDRSHLGSASKYLDSRKTNAPTARPLKSSEAAKSRSYRYVVCL